MTTHERRHPDDLEWIRADDFLLDSLGRGEAAPDDDSVAAMLAAWRADLADELPVIRAAAPGPETGDGEADATSATRTSTMPVIELETVRLDRGRRGRRLSRPRSIAVAATVTLLAALGGLCLASLSATPGSPLWPISQILNPGRADVLQAQAAIDKVRVAIEQQRYDDARRLIDSAQALINQVRDPADRQRLQGELDLLKLELAAKMSAGVLGSAPPAASGAPSPGRTPSPGTGAGAGGGAKGGGAGANPAPTPTAGGGGGLLPSLLPSLPLPGLPLPSISIVIHLP